MAFDPNNPTVDPYANANPAQFGVQNPAGGAPRPFTGAPQGAFTDAAGQNSFANPNNPGAYSPSTYTPNFAGGTPPAGTNTTPVGAGSAFGGGPPTGGKYSDPAYAASVVSYYANQPGANPSLKNDPNYWIQKITSGALGQDQGYWVSKFMTPEGAPAGGGPGGASGGAGAGAYTPGQGVSGQGTVFGANNPLTGQMSQMEQYLLNEATGAGSANPAFSTDPNSPIIQNQVQAYNNTQTQNERQNLAALAEKAGPNTNIGAETRAAGEQVGTNTANYQAQLMGQQLTARQNEIQQVLTQYGNTLTQEQQMQLQEELSQLQLAQQGYQYDQTQSNAVAGA